MKDKESHLAIRISLTNEIIKHQAELIYTLAAHQKDPAAVNQQVIHQMKAQLKELRDQVKRLNE